jgi:proteasome lid subunit RPN8/RPN11
VEKIKITPKQQQKIKDAALDKHPLEMCGVCTIDDFIELTNVHEDPENSFAFDPIEYARAVDKTVFIVHSHTKSIHDFEVYDLRTPSHKDMINQKRTGKPWLIVGCEGHEVSDPVQIPRTPSNDLIGRPFMWYINDCYSIVVDYYKFYMGIDIKLHDDSFNWSDINTLNSVFNEHIENYGFKWSSLDDLQNGDILVLSTRELNATHLGIFHNGNVIHQDGVSVEQPLSVFHRRINGVLRYAG